MVRCTNCTTGVKTSDGGCTNGCPPTPYTREDYVYVNVVGARYVNDENVLAEVTALSPTHVALSAVSDGSLITELTLEDWDDQLHGCYWSYVGMRDRR
jgi:hypothetical protein